jgi:hypothetical protein
VKGVDGQQAVLWYYTVCPSRTCRKATLNVSLCTPIYQTNVGWVPEKILRSWRLVPEDTGKVQPDYIPKAIREDYAEACAIREKSPKASATLSRRCLQGMIRDFWKVTDKRTLKDEIEAIKDRVQPKVWQAIDAIRKIGNIGAHMEKDINVIVDVDIGEAEALIHLIEMLINEWYVADHTRDQQIANVIKIAAKKEQAKE